MENKWLDSVVEAHRTYFGGRATFILDVGTRDGDDAEFLREKLEAEGVYAIDANPIAAQATADAYPDFTVFQTAVSRKNGSATFLQIQSDNKDWDGTSSLDVTKAARDKNIRDHAHYITVPVVRLDTLFEEEGLDDVIWDVVKIDVESYTYDVLEGLGKYIHKVKIFHLETEPKYNRDGHRNHEQVASYMRYHGFHLYDLSYEWGPGIQDQVWLNKKRVETKITTKELSERNLPKG